MRAALALACAGFAAGHAVLLIWTQYKGVQSGIVNWPVLLAPALLTLAFLPSSWRHWKRWALLYFVVFVCNPVLLPQVIVAAETVVLYSVWVRDRQPGDLEWIRGAARSVARLPFRSAGNGPSGAVPERPVLRQKRARSNAR